VAQVHSQSLCEDEVAFCSLQPHGVDQLVSYSESQFKHRDTWSSFG
jgi:hypothetical protein